MFFMVFFVSSPVFILRADLPAWLFCKCVRCVSLGPLWGSKKTLTKAEDMSGHFSLYSKSIGQGSSPVFLWCSAMKSSESSSKRLFPISLRFVCNWLKRGLLWGELHLSSSSPALSPPSQSSGTTRCHVWSCSCARAPALLFPARLCSIAAVRSHSPELKPQSKTAARVWAGVGEQSQSSYV